MQQPAAWTWFHDPRAIGHGERTFVTWHEPGGIWVGASAGQSWHKFQLAATSDANDHHVAALGIRSDERLIASYAQHNKPMYIRTSANPNDVASWGPERDLDLGRCTYPNLVYLAAEKCWYLIYRRHVASKHMPIVLRASKDDGETWSDAVTLFDVDGHRPYFKVATNGRDRIDLAVTDGHPNEYADNSIYHFAYDRGIWTDSHGNDLGEPTFSTEGVTLVHDGTLGEPAWVWDVAPGPVIAFAAFPTPDDHRYMKARWDDGWVVNQVAFGGPRMATTDTEMHYSGGIAIDHSHPDTMFASVQDGYGWSIVQLTVSDRGDIIERVVARASVGEKHIRPVVVRGQRRLLWLAGRYDGYREFQTALLAYPPLSLG